MLVLFLIMAVSLAILVAGADTLVRGGSALALRFGMSNFFVGLTIVAFGTSAPELATGVTSTLQGAGDLTVGNVVGASIYNIAVILGISAIIRPIVIDLPLVRKEIPWLIASAALPLSAWALGGRLPRWFGVLLLGLLIVFVWRAYQGGKKPTQAEFVAAAKPEQDARPPMAIWLAVIFVVIGLACLLGGSHLLVDASVRLARMMGISELVIGLTIVSFGTASPELVTSIVAAFRGRSEIAVGNVIGSNIFNMLGILGVTTAIGGQHLSKQSLMFDLPVLLFVSAATLPVMTRFSRITRGEGVILVLTYVLYVVALFAYAPRWFG